MTKKRFLIAIAIVMVLILSVAVFVACNENQTKSHTVKFVDGESEIKSVSVEEGKTIADADVPADLTKDGYVFEGWFVGDVAFDKSAAITADVTYSAKWTKLHTVKFVDGDETIKTATVKDGEKLADSDIPADLTATGKVFEGWFDGAAEFDKDATITSDKTFAAKWVGLFNVTFKNDEETIKVAQVKDGAVIAAADIPEDLTAATEEFAFAGWFDGETEFDADAAVTANVVYTAKWNKVAYVVKFVNGDEVVKTSYISIAEDAKLAESDIAEAQAKAEYAFLGFYDGSVKAVAELAVDADRTFTAQFANESSYLGYWIDTENHLMLTITSDKKVSYSDISNNTFSYKTTTGALTYSTGYGYSRKSYEIVAFGDYAFVTVNGYDSSEEPYSETTMLTRKADAGLAAFYTMGRNKQFVVEDNGIISAYGTSALRYGYFYSETVDGATTYHFDFVVTSSLVQMTATVDEKGNYVLSGNSSYNGIYGKDVDGITYYGDSQYIYGLVNEDSTTYIYRDANNNNYYATISGDIALNNIVTVSYDGGKSVVFTITKLATASLDGSIKQASAERGTYTGANGEIALDGFGKATVGSDSTYTYYKNGVDVIVLSNDTTTIGIVLDTKEGTYTVKDVDAHAGTFKQNSNSYYTLILDGFGGVNYKYTTSNSSSITYGKYEFSADGLTVKFSGVNSSVNGTYNIEESGNAFVESTSERQIFIKNGYTVTSKESDFVGYYVDENGNAIEITIEDGRIWLNIGGLDKRVSKNWNGTVLTYSAQDTDAADGYTSYYRDYIIKLVDGKLVISHDCIQSYDDVYEEYETIAKSTTYSKTEKPFAFPESARGTWYLDDNTIVVIEEKSITVGGVVGTDYNKSSYYYEFKIAGVAYIVYEDDSVAGKWYYCPADSYDAIELSKTEHVIAPTLDGLQGTYVNGSNTITLDGQGNGVYNNGSDYSFMYSGTGSTKTVSDFASYDDGENTFTVTATGIDVHFSGCFGDDVYNASFTKQASQEDGDAISADMQGTFTGTNGYSTEYTLVVKANSIEYKEVDSAWNVNISETITDYVISDEGLTISWTISDTTYKFSNPTGYAFKLYIGSYDYTLTQA